MCLQVPRELVAKSGQAQKLSPGDAPRTVLESLSQIKKLLRDPIERRGDIDLFLLLAVSFDL